MCLLCPDTALDILGHHAVTCKRGGDVVTRHNCLRDTFVDLCRNAHLSAYPEMSGQKSELIRGLRINEYSRISSRRHVWGTSIPSTPDFSQHLP